MAKLLQLFFVLLFVTQAALSEDTSSAVTKTLLWPDGTRYVGGVVDGKRSGKGTIFWQDGTRFVGTFVDDKRNGPGTMILPDGTVYNGYFENDTLVERSEGSAIAAQAEPSAPVAQISADELPDSEPVTETEPEPEPTLAQTTTPEPEPASEPTALALTTEARQSAQDAIDVWAAAWSDQNVEQYLAAYSADFDVPGRQSRRQWEGLRRSRLTRPSRINVRITYDSFELISANTMEVRFNQVYDSNLFSDRTNKQLVLRNENGRWRILSERSL